MNRRIINIYSFYPKCLAKAGNFLGTSKVVFQYFLLLFLYFFSVLNIQAQKQEDSKAIDILNKSMGVIVNEEGSMAVYFEGIAYGVTKPEDIFSIPSYKIFRGGFMINDGKKFEVQLGLMKALCDGKVMVMIDESAKTMVVDSLREKMPGFNQMPDIEKIMNENFAEGVFKYEGTEMIKGKQCYKVKSEFPSDATKHVYYYVETSSDKLLLIAEWQGGSYDVYWIKRISKAPTNHIYSVNLPAKELDNFYGYEVYDFRYISEELKSKK